MFFKKLYWIFLITPFLTSCGCEHVGGEVKGFEATCITDGLTDGIKCQKCGEWISPQQVIPAYGHSVVVDESRLPTSTSDGLTEGSHCKICGEIFSAQEVIKKENYFYFVNFEANPLMGKIIGQTNQAVKKSELINKVKAEPLPGYEFVEWSNGSTSNPLTYVPSKNETITALFKIKELELPIFKIETTDRAEVVSKDDYVGLTLSISNVDEKYERVDLSGKIKGHGNATMGYPKKPYKIKFDSKEALLGMNKSKSWILLAGYCDKTLLRGALGFETSKIFDLDYTVDYRFVDLYMNDEYLGVYQLTESIDQGKNKINVEDSGYIIECSSYDDKENKFISKTKELLYNFKFPDDDDVTSEQIEYAKSTIDKFESVLYDVDEIAFSIDQGYRNYIDVESWAKWFLVQNVLANIDTNIYLTKANNLDSSLIKFGPVWDFEWSNGIGWYDGERPNPNNNLMTNIIYFERLLEDQYFKDCVINLWDNVKDTIIDDLINFMDSSVDVMKNSISRNFEKWDILNTKISVGGIPLGSYEKELECDKTYLKNHILWLNSEIESWKSI